MKAGIACNVKLILRAINKKGLAEWQVANLGSGISVNPYIMAYSLLVSCVDSYLKSLQPVPLGMIIADENAEIADDVDKSLVLLKDHLGEIRVTQFIEKTLFIQSHKSHLLQLCDLFTFSVRKHIEVAFLKHNQKSFDVEGMKLSNSIVVPGPVHHDDDVMHWIIEINKPTPTPESQTAPAKTPPPEGHPEI